MEESGADFGELGDVGADFGGLIFLLWVLMVVGWRLQFRVSE